MLFLTKLPPLFYSILYYTVPHFTTNSPLLWEVLYQLIAASINIIFAFRPLVFHCSCWRICLWHIYAVPQGTKSIATFDEMNSVPAAHQQYNWLGRLTNSHTESGFDWVAWRMFGDFSNVWEDNSNDVYMPYQLPVFTLNDENIHMLFNWGHG